MHRLEPKPGDTSKDPSKTYFSRKCRQESWASTAGNVGPFSMATLRTAETESREEEWNMSHDCTEKKDERVMKDDEITGS